MTSLTSLIKAGAGIPVFGRFEEHFSAAKTLCSFGWQESWQPLGYLLADTTDQYKLHHLGIGALRRCRIITWTVQDYLNSLVGQRTKPVEWWRVELARTLIDLASAISRAPVAR